MYQPSVSGIQKSKNQKQPMCTKVGRWLKKLYNIYISLNTLLPGKRMELLWHGRMSEIHFLVKK